MNELYLLLDAAKMDGLIHTARELNKNCECLYKGGSEEELADYAPYIFSFEQDTEFAVWIHHNGFGNSWGIFVNSEESMEVIYKHFRKFLMVKTEEGKQLYFRFYDPRVLRIFLPTCDAQQLAEFFGPIHYFFMEDEDPNFALKFSLKNGELQTERIKQNLSVTV
jgi:hypothetical protein